MKNKQKLLIATGLIAVLFLGFFSFFSFENQGVRAGVTFVPVRPDLNYRSHDLGPTGNVVAKVSPSQFENIAELGLIPLNESQNYENPVVHLYGERVVKIEVNIPSSGYYHLSFNYLTLGREMVHPMLGISINGEYQMPSASRISANIWWQDATHDFSHNRFGHDVVPQRVQINEWFHTYARSGIHWRPTPLLFYFETGVNEITITSQLSEIYLGHVYVSEQITYPTYAEYREALSSRPTNQDLLIVEGEHPLRKSSSFIRQISIPSADVYPYDSSRLLLNAIGGDSWSTNGQSITWQIEIPVAGDYHLTFHGGHDIAGTSVFRTIAINGSVPFEELNQYAFEYSSRFKNHTLSDKSGIPFEIFFEAGIHEITLTANSEPIMSVVDTLASVREAIREVSLDIRQLTGGQNDPNRDWEIDEFIPNIDELFETWISQIRASLNELQTLFPNTRESQAELDLQLIINSLNRLASRPNELPSRMTELSEGATSVTQMLGTLEQTLQEQPLILNAVYIHSDVADIPAPTTTWARRMSSTMSQFWSSFNVTDSTPDSDDVLEIWVGRSQFHVELLQNMTDSIFTPETGIHVRFSVMPNPQKLVLANAAGEQPDLAIGITNWLPFQMALRGAAADLSKFDGFEEMIENFSPGAFLPLMIDGGLYGFPETQDFYVLFYRSDMMEQLGIPIPDTWEEVVQILPELQRQGLNFFSPLSGPAAMKPFMFTAPFFYQFGGDVHSFDALSTGINSEESLAAMRFMTDLYMVYSLPLQVANFYNDFRYGLLPIGIGNFQTYLELTVAAPEIAGNWNIALHPGVDDGNGNIVRWTTGSAQSAMILEASENQDAAWEFLQWWLSTETQVAFSNNLITLFGPEFTWHTSNLEAFAALPIPQEHRDVILAQWEHMREVPMTPASYIIEREISNIWNSVVFNGANLRAQTDAAVIRINREIRRRMEEFGYVDSHGNPLRPYILPTIELVEEWIKNDND